MNEGKKGAEKNQRKNIRTQHNYFSFNRFIIRRDNSINRIDRMNIQITKEKIAIWVLALIAVTLLSVPK